MASYKRDSRDLTPLLLAELSLLLIVMSMCSTNIAEAHKKPKKLSFFMFVAVQNNSFLENPKGQFTSVLSGEAPVSPQQFAFGNLHTFDNPLSKTMSLANPADSVGRVQGWYGNCGQSTLTLCLTQTFAYNDSIYSGSFSLLGSGVATDPVKYAAIVGGTGDFAFCRGVAEQSRVFNAFVNSEETSWFHYNVTFKF
ncbi:hypothetical protein L7F22_046662 [Adiantum nelumboides]|nr:hypothetical protein [Adiantum nelumboides]